MSGPVLPPGVIVLERGWLSSNNVVLLGEDEAALIDSGYCTHAEQTLDLVSRAIGDRRLTMLVNTHLHSDHCGGNALLQQRHPALRTLIPPGQAAAVRDWDAEALSYAPTGQECPAFGFQDVLQQGSVLSLAGTAWDVHAAPGHDPHSVVLFEPVTRTLVSADALWENGFGIVFPELEGERAFADVGATLDLIEELQPAVVIPGHGRVFTDVSDALARARSRLRAYVSDPRRHGAHAAKVLLKFKLLDLQNAGKWEFVSWAAATPYVRQVHGRFFSDTDIREWIASLLSELEKSGAVRYEDQLLING